MVAVYILILCATTLFSAWAARKLWLQFGPMLSPSNAHVGLCAVGPALAFLIVVAAPPALLFFACAILAICLLAPLRMRPFKHQALLLILTALLVMWLHPLKDVTWLPLLGVLSSFWLLTVLALFLWLCTMLLTAGVPSPVPETAALTIFTCLPLAASAIFYPPASAVAIDAAILASAWLGAWAASALAHPVGKPAHVANIFVLGYLHVEALAAGAWPFVIPAALIWVVGARGIERRATARLLAERPHA